MKPAFAQFVDPVFMRALAFLDSKGGFAPSVSRQISLVDEIEKAEVHLESDSSWPDAKYALVCWINELGKQVDRGSGGWEDLEWKYFQTTESHETFFQRARQVANRSGIDDALETYFVCFMLGFRGVYREGNSHHLTQLGLRPTAGQWAQEIAEIIEGRRRAQRERAEHTRDRSRWNAPTPLLRLRHVVWPWLVSLFLAGAIVVWFRDLFS